MKTILFFSTILILFTGCFNKRGVSATYYNNCHEYYDIQGNYHKECDENMLEYEDVKKVFKKKEEAPTSNVW